MNFFVASILILTLNLLFCDELLPSLKGLVLSFYIGAFEMAIPFVLWLYALKLTLSTDKISNLVFLSPFVSLILLHYILGEDIYTTTLIGLAFIITGIAIQQFKMKLPVS